MSAGIQGGERPAGRDDSGSATRPSRTQPRPADDTRRGRDMFSRASTRLFLLFAAIVIVLLVVSGITTYAIFTTALHDVTRGHLSQAGEEELVTRTSARLRWQILAIDGAIVVAIGGLGFWYARRTLRPIRENFAAQKRFVADASHELRTPLAIMKTEFEVALRHEPQQSDAGRALESGLEEVDRMSDIVQDLLTLSRIDARQEELHFTPLDLAALARRCGEKLRPLAQKRDVALTVRAAGPLTVEGDVAHLERALLNVVRNAIEHSHAGDEVALAAQVADGRRSDRDPRRRRRDRAGRPAAHLRPLLPRRRSTLAGQRRQRPRPRHHALDGGTPSRFRDGLKHAGRGDDRPPLPAARLHRERPDDVVAAGAHPPPTARASATQRRLATARPSSCLHPPRHKTREARGWGALPRRSPPASLPRGDGAGRPRPPRPAAAELSPLSNVCYRRCILR